jgi:hypothetical protein
LARRTPVGAAPNAVLSVLKILIKRLEPFIRLPWAKEIARILGEVCFKVLRLAYDWRLLHGAQAVLTIDMVREAIPKEFWDWFFDDVTEADLDAVVRFGKAITPSFDYTAPLDKTAAMVEAIAAGDPARLADLMERLWARVEVIAEFFNPTWRSFLQMRRVTKFLARLRKLARERGLPKIDTRILDMVREGGNWRFSDALTRDQAREWLLKAMEELGDAIEALDVSPKALRGLIGFTLGSGPHKASGFLEDLRQLGDKAFVNKYLEGLHDVAELVFKSTDGNADEKLRVLNRLWSALYVTSPDPAVRESARLGVEAMVLALLRYKKRIPDRVDGGAINPLDARGRQLLDSLMTGRAAMEVKGLDGRQTAQGFRNAIDGCVSQFVDSCYRIVEEGRDVRTLYYCVHITGNRAAALERFRKLRAELRRAREELADFASSDPDFPLVVPRLRFVFLTPRA